MGKPSILGSADYRMLTKIMIGPHGAPLTPRSPVGVLVVFSCADPEVGRAAARLHRQRLVRQVVFSGGFGKDSAGLPALGITEAAFLASVAVAEGLSAEHILLEQEARNGTENAAHALRLAAKLELLPPRTRVASLAPATRSRRLYEELRYQADIGLYDIDVAAGLSSGTADPDDPQVREELIRELRGLRTMHNGATPRIYQQLDLQPGGTYWDLAQRADLGD
jgi:hypothetical protein